MSDYEKIVHLCNELGRSRVFAEMGYKSSQNFLTWKKGIPLIARPAVNAILKKYKRILPVTK